MGHIHRGLERRQNIDVAPGAGAWRDRNNLDQCADARGELGAAIGADGQLQAGDLPAISLRDSRMQRYHRHRVHFAEIVLELMLLVAALLQLLVEFRDVDVAAGR